MIKIKEREKERERDFANNTYISLIRLIPNIELVPLLPFLSFLLIFARPFIHFLSFSLVIALSLFLFLFAALYRSRNSTCASTPELRSKSKKKSGKKNDRSFVYSIVSYTRNIYWMFG